MGGMGYPEEVVPPPAPTPAPVGPISPAPGVAQDDAGSFNSPPPESPLPEEKKTTVMLRKLPPECQPDDVYRILDQNGFRAQFDFYYIPMDFEKGSCSGYGFVNLVSHESAIRCQNKFKGLILSKEFPDDSRFQGLTTDNAIEVGWAKDDQQGLEAQVKRFRNSQVMHPKVDERFKPKLFKDGVLQEWPAPTKAIPEPKASSKSLTLKGAIKAGGTLTA